MSAWEFVGLTESEYDKRFFQKVPRPTKCAYPKCKNKRGDNVHFCEEHFKQLQAYLTATNSKEGIKQ